MAERDKLILGARAPSPAMSAKRENSCGVKKFEIERAADAPAGESARAPSTNRLVPDRIDLGKAQINALPLPAFRFLSPGGRVVLEQFADQFCHFYFGRRERLLPGRRGLINPPDSPAVTMLR